MRANMADGLVQLVVDDPVDRLMQRNECQLRLWCACADSRILERLIFRTSAGVLGFRSVARPDAELAHPNLEVTGFVVPIFLSDHLGAVNKGKLTISMVVGKQVIGQFDLRLTPEAIRKATERATC
jgi:hypothetical protein